MFETYPNIRMILPESQIDTNEFEDVNFDDVEASDSLMRFLQRLHGYRPLANFVSDEVRCPHFYLLTFSKKRHHTFRIFPTLFRRHSGRRSFWLCEINIIRYTFICVPNNITYYIMESLWHVSDA